MPLNINRIYVYMNMSQPAYIKANIALSLLERQAVNRLGERIRARVCSSVIVAMKTASEKRDSTPTIPAGTGG